MSRVLAELRVIDFTWVLAGPYATRVLADFGAEVIKVQSRLTSREEDNLNGYFNTWNRNKLSITLNLSKPQGIEIAKRLIGISDVVMENFSSRVMKNWGLDYHQLEKINPNLIMVSLSAMGQTGPYQNYVGFGATVQAFGGLTHLTTFPGKPPMGLGYAYADHIAGLMAALAVLGALEYRREAGRGQYIDLAEFEATASLLGPAILDYIVNHQVAIPAGNQPAYATMAPYGIYPCSGEDRWCAISISSDEQWQAFSQVIGNPLWTKEARFATLESRREHQQELDSKISEWTKNHTAEEAMEQLQKVGVAAGVVKTAADLAQDPQLQSRGFFAQADHPILGKVLVDSSPMKLSLTPGEFSKPAPLLGQDNHYVYHDLLGMSDEEISRLTEEGVFD
jgi:benzylsuccinate CoA-transferase BbsF subunit